MDNKDINFSKLSFDELAALCRKEAINLTNLSYGSGGYCISLLDSRSGQFYTSFSWNSTEALEKCVKNVLADRAMGSAEEEKTLPQAHFTAPDKKTITDIKIKKVFAPTNQNLNLGTPITEINVPKVLAKKEVNGIYRIGQDDVK